MVTKEDLKAERDLLQDMINNVGLYADEEIRKQTKKLETLRKRAESEGVRQEEITETSQADTRKFGRFLQAMAHEARTGETSEELKANRASQRAATGVEAGSPSEGGFLLDRDLAPDLYMRTYNNQYIYQNSDRYTVTGNAASAEFPYCDESSRADGSRFGAMRGYWKDEGSQLTGVQPKFGKITMGLLKLTVLVYVTGEMMQDSGRIGEYVTRMASEELAFKMQKSFFSGDGAGKPSGIKDANCTIEITKEGSQTADSIVYENVCKMWARMWGPSRSRSVWIANGDIIPELFTMSLAVGTAGSSVFMPKGGASASPYDTLLGRPIQYIEQAETVGDDGDLMLADLSQYLIIEKGGIQTAVSKDIRFDYDEVCFRFIVRCSGQSKWSEALTPFKGSDTVSPFLKIADRT